MIDRTSNIFNNPMSKKVIKGGNKSKAKYIKKYGDDSKEDYKISFKEIPTLDFIGANNIVFGEENQKFEDNALIVGNNRWASSKKNTIFGRSKSPASGSFSNSSDNSQRIKVE